MARVFVHAYACICMKTRRYLVPKRRLVRGAEHVHEKDVRVGRFHFAALKPGLLEQQRGPPHQALLQRRGVRHQQRHARASVVSARTAALLPVCNVRCCWQKQR
jgi:hypothetical protein